MVVPTKHVHHEVIDSHIYCGLHEATPIFTKHVLVSVILWVATHFDPLIGA